MNQQTIDKIVGKIPDFPERSYWFFRTNGGQYYGDFLSKGFIAIDYNEVSLKQITGQKGKVDTSKLIETIQKAYPEEKRPVYIVTQLLDFVYEIKKNDIVVIPSFSSDYISIGQVEESEPYSAIPKIEDPLRDCPYEKRKKVKWIVKNLWFGKLDSKLIYLKYSQRTITHIGQDVISLIDREIQPFYKKNDKSHLNVSIVKKEHLKAVAFFEFYLDVLTIAEDYCREYNIEFDKNSVDIKLNVQSPGMVELIGEIMAGLAVVTGLMITIIGGEFEANIQGNVVKYKIGGLLDSITKYKNNKVKRELMNTLKKKAEEINFDKDQMFKLLEQINRIDEEDKNDK